jgi:hypothetical protein
MLIVTRRVVAAPQEGQVWRSERREMAAGEGSDRAGRPPLTGIKSIIITCFFVLSKKQGIMVSLPIQPTEPR